jgi:hypothetical protein
MLLRARDLKHEVAGLRAESALVRATGARRQASFSIRRGAVRMTHLHIMGLEVLYGILRETPELSRRAAAAILRRA